MRTIRELAKAAGVSPTTASHALSGKGRMRPEIRQRVMELAEEYHYTPTTLPISAWPPGVATIGCIVPDISSAFCSRILKGVMEESLACNYHVIVLETHGDIAITWAALQSFAELQVQGVLCYSGHDKPIPRETVFKLRSHEIPLIPIGTISEGDASDCRVAHNENIAKLALDYLMNLGHQHIAFMGPLTGDLGIRGMVMLKQLQKRGFSTDLSYEVYGESDIAPALAHAFGRKHPTTAIVAFNDDVAAYVIRSLHKQKIAIPGNVSVLGNGNLPYSSFLTPALTTIDTLPEQVGQHAVRILHRHLSEGTSLEGIAEQLMFPPRLIIRESCARCEHHR